MQMKRLSKSLSLIVCIVLIAAMALIATGCNDNKKISGSSPDTAETQTVSEALGEGATAFIFSVTDAEGNKTSYQINTDKKTVGDALIELNLIAGDDSDFGLYVKTVNGITIDPDKEKRYWAFYVNGEYAPKGVDSTDIEPNAEYSFKIESF